ncbi:MAG: division/cell wall cluster transcriptional repressor MraZ [Methylococcaceae bacterium]|nr:division/cell wall cluster transcriptional repressor MraZ [Methylococcaceae bacterium]
MFRGVNPINLDEKGRLAVPTRYRAALQDCCEQQLVLTVSPDKCLLLYPMPEWERIERDLSKLPSLDKRVKRLQRLLIGHATECQMDSQGRVLIAEPLRKFASLEKRVVLVGQGPKFEIWDEDVWNHSCEEWVEEENLDDRSDLPPGLDSLSY